MPLIRVQPKNRNPYNLGLGTVDPETPKAEEEPWGKNSRGTQNYSLNYSSFFVR